LIVGVELLILGATQGYITAPLISNNPIIHEASNNVHYLGVKKELRAKAGLIKRHRKEVPVGSTIGLRVIDTEVFGQNWPESISA